MVFAKKRIDGLKKCMCSWDMRFSIRMDQIQIYPEEERAEV